MSVMQAVIRPTRTFTSPLLRQRRLASHGAHDAHHDAHDAVEYPKEGFTGPFWRNLALFTVGFVSLVTFVPSDVLSGSAWKDIEDAPWLTRVLAYYAPSKENWTKANAKHVELAEERAEAQKLIQGAKLPIVMRYRYPLKFEQTSAHRVPVGGMPDLDDLVVKS